GYDRLTAGPALVEQIGYLYLDKRRFLNFFFALEFTQGFTRSQRSWNFGAADASGGRFDVLSGVKIGLIVPIYFVRMEEERFFYD
ncbi:MAG: hypothetical protein WBA12_04345, partial [Catalinimonas sp.]